MANIGDIHRMSMLDIILELESHNKNLSLHSVIIIAQVNSKLDDIYAKIAQHYEQLFNTLQGKYQCEAPSGLLMMYSNYCFHYLEAHYTIIEHTLRDLYAQQTVNQAGKSLFQEANIVQYLTQIKCPLLPIWKSSIVDLQIGNDDAYTTTDSLDVVVGSIIRTFYKLVSTYHKLPRSEAQRFLDNIHERADLVVPKEKLEYLLKQPELMKPKDFYTIFGSKNNTYLQGQQVWPAPRKIFDV